ncbi:SapC [compost metagenome]
MQAVPNEGKGAPVSMTGLSRINEDKLNALDGDKLKELAQKGMLARVYLHLASLSNFSRLLDRRAAAAATKH